MIFFKFFFNSVRRFDFKIALVVRLGFHSYILISELVEIFPDLDYVDHEKRKQLLVRMETLNFLF
jgi:hypothetical protein